MSRYVDLDGLTWDGKTISSKIQEVQTKGGYMQGITVGWLWGDNVPHIDLADHDKQIRAEVIEEFEDWLFDQDEIFFPIEAIGIIRKKLKQMKGE